MKFREQQEKARMIIIKALEELDLTVPSFGNHGNLGSECVVVAWYAIDLAMSKKGWVHSNLCIPPVGIQFRPRETVDTGDVDLTMESTRESAESKHGDP